MPSEVMSIQEVPVEQRSLTGEWVEIQATCARLLKETEVDTHNFQHEQTYLKNRILGALEENNRLNAKLEELGEVQSNNETKDDASRDPSPNEVLTNIKKQILFLQTENGELRHLQKCSEQTIKNLETAIEKYRTQLLNPQSIENIQKEVSKKYEQAIRVLDTIVGKQKVDIENHLQIISNLLEEQNSLRKHIESLEKSVTDMRKTSSKLKANEKSNDSNKPNTEAMRQQLDLSTKRCKYLEKLLKEIIENRCDREKDALEKVQEALSIVDSAVSEKMEAQTQALIVKEECDNLASTITEVMEEAACKVEKDIQQMKQKFKQRENMLIESNRKINEQLLCQKNYNELLTTKYSQLEAQLQKVLSENGILAQQLQAATASLEDMIAKAEENANLFRDTETKRLAEEHEQEIKQFLDANSKLKEKYKKTIEDITRKCEREINHLRAENVSLKAENQCLLLQKEHILNDIRFT